MILIDLLLITFLAICIYYCTVLNKRINELQNSRNEFNKMIKEFDLAIVRAESSINDLTKLSKETSAKIHKVTEKAQFILNDMTFMNDMGSDVANRLEKAIDNAKIVEKRLNINNSYVPTQASMSNSIAGNATINQNANPKAEIENIMARFGANKTAKEPANNEQNSALHQLIRQAK
jgi:Domain of unknown function (DUF6468)